MTTEYYNLYWKFLVRSIFSYFGSYMCKFFSVALKAALASRRVTDSSPFNLHIVSYV